MLQEKNKQVINVSTLKLIVVVFLFIFCFADIANLNQAKAVDNDFSIWPTASVTVPLGEKIMLQELVNPRFNDNATNFDQLLLRSAAGYKLNKNFSLWAGYDWLRTYRMETTDEHRPWQQVLLVNKFDHFRLSNRFRMEERIFDDGTVARGRYRLRFDVPLDKESVTDFVIFDEIFFNFNSAAMRDAGLDENRLFVGLNRRITHHIAFEAGYQMQYNHTPEIAQVINHTILANVIIDFRGIDLEFQRIDPTL